MRSLAGIFDKSFSSKSSVSFDATAVALKAKANRRKRYDFIDASYHVIEIIMNTRGRKGKIYKGYE
jgi:hypothetical protein